MKRLCEYFDWGDFKKLILKPMFPNAESIALEESGAYQLRIYVEYADEEGALVYNSTEIANMWSRIDDFYTIYDIHCDSRGIWVVYEQDEII